MKKVILIIAFMMLLTACRTNEEPYQADIDDMDPYCSDGMIYQDGTCINEEPIDDDTNPIVDDDPNTVVDETEDCVVIQNLINAISSNEDFQNTWFEEEKDYYSQFFTSSSDYQVDYEEIIAYDVEDLIFHEGSVRAYRMVDGLTSLLELDVLDQNQVYETNNGFISYFLSDGILNMTIDNSSDNRYGWYRLSLTDGVLWFDVLESSKDSPFEGTATNYILYYQNQAYLERSVVTDGTNQHYFQYDYSFDTNVVKTIIVTAMPSYGFYDIGRAERHFDENYYVVYSSGTSYSHRYFTLFHDHHASINVSDMSVSMGDETFQAIQLQWNLLDIEGWDYIKNNRVYVEDTSYPITPFTYLELPYYGPEFTLFEDYTTPFTNDDLRNPLDAFTYDVYTLDDCYIAQQQLDTLESQFSVTETSYTLFNEVKMFEDGFESYLYEVIQAQYINDFLAEIE